MKPISEILENLKAISTHINDRHNNSNLPPIACGWCEEAIELIITYQHYTSQLKESCREILKLDEPKSTPEKVCPEPEAHRCKNCGNFYEGMPMGEAPCFGKTSSNCGMWTPIERLVEAYKTIVKPDVSSEFPAEIKHIGIDLVEKHFPKGECKERGQAIVLYAELIIRFQKLMAEKDTLLEGSRQIVDNYQKWMGKKEAEIARLNEVLSEIATGKHPQKRCVEIAERGMEGK